MSHNTGILVLLCLLSVCVNLYSIPSRDPGIPEVLQPGFNPWDWYSNPGILKRIVHTPKIGFHLIISRQPNAHIEKKVTINRFCCELFSRIRGNVDVEENLSETQSTTTSGNNSEYSDPENVSVQEKLQLVIDASLKNPKESSQNTLPLSTLLKYELTIAEQTGKRGNFLEEIYQMLYVIPPTSAEAERIFSSAAYLCNRFRSRLNDETIDALVFIRNNISI